MVSCPLVVAIAGFLSAVVVDGSGRVLLVFAILAGLGVEVMPLKAGL